ncbi:MAG: carbonic anhydrase [Oscillospiraceae bacterium]|jgi:carbonic anhydrase|nr:carbonic anhydrase [Oscillospiraceae bacterium]
MKDSSIIQKLKDGNAAFLSGEKPVGNISPDLRKALSENGQSPYAVIITCSDSRVVPEYIFSASPGDLFIIRTAGCVVDDFERGTVEYGVRHLGSKLVCVMGHTKCGAVGAAMHSHGEEPEALTILVGEVKSAIGDEQDSYTAIKLDTQNSIKRLKESTYLKEQAASGDIEIIGAMYDIDTGAVEFFE